MQVDVLVGGSEPRGAWFRHVSLGVAAMMLLGAGNSLAQQDRVGRTRNLACHVLHFAPGDDRAASFIRSGAVTRVTDYGAFVRVVVESARMGRAWDPAAVADALWDDELGVDFNGSTVPTDDPSSRARRTPSPRRGARSKPAAGRWSSSDSKGPSRPRGVRASIPSRA